MFKNCGKRLRLMPFLICWGVCLGDDDVVVPGIAMPVNRGGDDGAVTILNQTQAQRFLEDELRYNDDEFRANSDLNRSQQAKLSLACRADVRRVSREVKQFHHAAIFREQQNEVVWPRFVHGENASEKS